MLDRTLSIGDITVDEEDGTAVIPVTFDGGFSGSFSVPWATADGTANAGDSYTAASGTLTFSGAAETKNIEITLLDDSMVEYTKNFLVNLGAITGDPMNEIIVNDDSAWCAIENTDTAQVILDFDTSAGSSSAMDEGTGGAGSHTVTFRVRLDNPVDVAAVVVDWATFDYTAEAGTDYVSGSGTELLNGTYAETFTVTVNHDSVVELTNIFGVELSNLDAGNLTPFVTFSSPTAHHQIKNDDQATVSISPPGAAWYDEANATITLGVQLAGRVDYPVVLDIMSASGTASSGSGDYTALVTHVTFEAYPDNTDSEAIREVLLA